MATQRYISTSFWDDAWIQTLDPTEKLLYLYLISNPLTNIAGAYKITTRRIVFDTGIQDEKVKSILDKFNSAGKACMHGEYMIIPTWPKHQQWEKRTKIKYGIEAVLKEMPEDVLKYMVSIGYAYPIDMVSIPYAYDRNYSDIDSDYEFDSDSDTKPKADKEPVSEHLRLTTTEQEELAEEYGDSLLQEVYEEIEHWISNRKNGKFTWKDHKRGIKNWIKKKREFERARASPDGYDFCEKCGAQKMDGRCRSCDPV